jgi:alcohol dehydrogenase class IV
MDALTLPAELVLPARTISGGGAAAGLLKECATFGRRGMLVHGASLKRAGVLDGILRERPDGLEVRSWQHPGGEPTLAHLESLLEAARAHRAEWVAAVGGGSVMDVGKACAGLLRAPLPAVAYHDGAPIPVSQTPFAAVPATAGTGSEATVITVLTNEKTGVKKSFRHASHMARVVILDHRLLDTCPPGVIAASGMDAFTQAVEAFSSVFATWLSDALSLKGVELIAGSLEAVHGGARGDRARDLLQGSYLAGLALSMARLGVVHGLAHPLGSRYHLPHGLVCAVCLPAALDFNAAHMGRKYERLSQAAGADLRGAVKRMLSTVGIESPFRGRPLADVKGIVEETLASGSTAANPRPVAAADVESLLRVLFAP